LSNSALSVNNLSVSYGSHIALSNIQLEVPSGEYLGIIGPNGGGKSTLLKAVLGLIPAINGDIHVLGKSLENSKGLIGYVPQFSGVDKQFPITVSDVVLTGLIKKGLSFFHKFSKEDRNNAGEILSEVGIYQLRHRQISELSGGEFQKMLIARALALNPKLLLLDEPTASVDAKSREQIYSLLAKLNEKMTIILVTHDLLAVSSQVKSIACLNKELIYHGEPELNSHITNTLYGCPVDLIAHGVPHRVLKEHGEGECCG